jgi:hypothetical protein
MSGTRTPLEKFTSFIVQMSKHTLEIYLAAWDAQETLRVVSEWRYSRQFINSGGDCFSSQEACIYCEPPLNKRLEVRVRG